MEGSGPGNGSGPASSSQFYFRAKIDGILLECPIASATFYPAIVGNSVQIAGNKGAEGFGFTLFEYKGVGTYDLSDMTKSSGVYLLDPTNPLDGGYMATSGTLVISMVNDKLIKGTFSFKGETLSGKVKTITEGIFQISLAPVVAPPPAAGNESMSAKIDGTLINFTADGYNVKGPQIGNTMSIIGLNGTKQMAIAIDNYKGVGTYEYENATSASYNLDSGFTGIFNAESQTGKITITSDSNNQIEGTFNFTGRNADPTINTTKVISEGKFKVKYTTMTMP